MKKIEVEISLRDARNGYWRIEDNRFLSENGEWTASNIWESKEFEETELEEMESLIEGVLSGLEYEIAIVEF